MVAGNPAADSDLAGSLCSVVVQLDVDTWQSQLEELLALQAVYDEDFCLLAAPGSHLDQESPGVGTTSSGGGAGGGPSSSADACDGGRRLDPEELLAAGPPQEVLAAGAGNGDGGGYHATRSPCGCFVAEAVVHVEVPEGGLQLVLEVAQQRHEHGDCGTQGRGSHGGTAAGVKQGGQRGAKQQQRRQQQRQEQEQEEGLGWSASLAAETARAKGTAEGNDAVASVSTAMIANRAKEGCNGGAGGSGGADCGPDGSTGKGDDTNGGWTVAGSSERNASGRPRGRGGGGGGGGNEAPGGGAGGGASSSATVPGSASGSAFQQSGRGRGPGRGDRKPGVAEARRRTGSGGGGGRRQVGDAPGHDAAGGTGVEVISSPVAGREGSHGGADDTGRGDAGGGGAALGSARGGGRGRRSGRGEGGRSHPATSSPSSSSCNGGPAEQHPHPHQQRQHQWYDDDAGEHTPAAARDAVRSRPHAEDRKPPHLVPPPPPPHVPQQQFSQPSPPSPSQPQRYQSAAPSEPSRTPPVGLTITANTVPHAAATTHPTTDISTPAAQNTVPPPPSPPLPPPLTNNTSAPSSPTTASPAPTHTLVPFGASLTFLSPIRVTIRLPPTYPVSDPPTISLQAQWLSASQAAQLRTALMAQWVDGGAGSQIIFTWLDWLRYGALQQLGLTHQLVLGTEDAEQGDGEEGGGAGLGAGGDGGGGPGVGLEGVALSLVRYSAAREQEKFNESSICCSICLDQHLGARCVRLPECGDAFCAPCLTTHLRTQLGEGAVDNMRCPAPKCRRTLAPYVLQQLLTQDEYERWERLTLQRTLDRMEDLVYCPRCREPCLEDGDHCTLCPSCFYSFCSLCEDSWHPGRVCLDAASRLALLEERRQQGGGGARESATERARRELNRRNELLSLALLASTTKQCPVCSMGVEKTEGCNKMTCGYCGSYFCWKCNQVIRGYDHFQGSPEGGPPACVLFEQQEIDRWNARWGQVAPRVAQVEQRGQIVAFLQQRGGNQIRLCACVVCGQRNIKDGNNNNIRCWSCSSHFCYLCRTWLRTKPGLHFGIGPGRCRQHSED